MFLEGRGNPFPQTPLPFPSALYWKGDLLPIKSAPMNARLTRQAGAAIPQRRGSSRSSSVFIFHTGQTLLPFLPGDRQRGTAIMPRRPPSTRIKCVWGGVGPGGGEALFAWTKGPPLPRKNAARASPVPACPLDKSRERVVKNSFPHPVPARRLSRVPE